MCNIIKGMPEHEHLVAYFYHKPDQHLMCAQLEREGISYLQVDERYVDFPAFDRFTAPEIKNSLRAVMKDFQPDIVLRHFWEGRETAGRPVPLPRYRREKYICVIHDPYPAPPGYDYYVPTSRHNDEVFQGHIPRRKKTVIYNGIDVARFSVERSEHPGVVIGRMSTLLEKKIPADWVEFANSFEIPDVTFITGGEGPRKDAFLNKVRELGVENKFSFPGSVPYQEVPGWLSRFDLCCYLTDTHIETHSMMLIEMAAAGIPVVAEPRGSVPEQVVHGRTGLLASERDRIRYYCELLARERELREEMGERAREFGREFTIEKQCDQYRGVFAKLRGRKGRRFVFLPRGIGRY